MGIGMLTAGIILAIMVIPFIASVMRDVFEVVPPMLKESAYGARRHHLGSGLERGAALHQDRRGRRHHARPRPRAGRDHGGDLRHRQRPSISAPRCSCPGNSIASALANEFTEAVGDLYTSSLIELGLILFFITFIVLALSKLLLLQLAKREGKQT